MPKKKKAKANKISRDVKIPETKNLELSFSFRYLDLTNPKFSSEKFDLDYFLKLLARLRDLSSLKVLELKSNRSSALRCHPINWSDTTENCFGIPNEDQIAPEPYQISISANKDGRVHGFFLVDVFYIVWLDPDHALYP